MTQPNPWGAAPAAQPTCYAHPDRPAYVLCQRCNRPICGPDMIQAPVGYQCPTCVKQGNQGMRRVRGWTGLNRSFGQNATTVVIIALNVLIWLAILVTGWNASPLIGQLAIHRASFCSTATGEMVTSAAQCAAVGGQYAPGVLNGGWWQLLTSAFTHVNLMHIGFNMLALWMLGPQLERLFGRARYLVVYLGSALVGSLLVCLFSGAYTISLGASGAIFGLMAAMLLTAVRYHGDVRGILVWIGLNAVITLMGVGSISWQAHLGGFLGGLALSALMLWGSKPLRIR